MRLGTRLECIRSSPRVSGACEDDTREFTGRRLRLAGRLSRVAEKLAGSDSCIAHADGCIVVAQESGQQATVGPPRLAALWPVPYF
ncbi:hypothetical protein BHE74_00045295 [Ensete ventricosum]|nr:hypothetical protein GW17_00032405 [Ensete ventricosum]RWW48617.1 hypothetical protein BHE74_00045295 [Ensete ventricosum]